jgi:hypothetical protein
LLFLSARLMESTSSLCKSWAVRNPHKPLSLLSLLNLLNQPLVRVKHPLLLSLPLNLA